MATLTSSPPWQAEGRDSQKELERFSMSLAFLLRPAVTPRRINVYGETCGLGACQLPRSVQRIAARPLDPYGSIRVTCFTPLTTASGNAVQVVKEPVRTAHNGKRSSAQSPRNTHWTLPVIAASSPANRCHSLGRGFRRSKPGRSKR
jgi:hypothetical protein